MRKPFITIVVLLMCCSVNIHSSVKERVISREEGINYLSNTVVAKLNYGFSADFTGRVSLSGQLQRAFAGINIISAELMFPRKFSTAEGDLSRIVVIKYQNEIDPMLVSSKLKSLHEVEWIEPKYVYLTTYVPNDPQLNSQYALTKIKAREAWDVSKGDTSIVIGIVDTGVDWDHPDLNANIWRNHNEIPANTIDDDNNGYIDDVIGWDFGGLNGTPDNNPDEDRPDHGTHVAGDAAAVTDNSTGVASIGFNSRIMAVKTSQDDFRNPSGQAYIAFGYEGIQYAVDNGCKVINCSWGGGGYSFLGQEVIDYAVSNNVLVVAAAGNNNSPLAFYPASYVGVLSVASTDQGDVKSGFSNYGMYIDVSSPGSGIFSTWQNDTYATLSGTSMASPIAAGLAALTRAVFPSYNALQIAEQVRVNSDDLNQINPGYANLLGRGRINAFNTLNNVNSKSVRYITYIFSDDAPGGNGNGILESGETIALSLSFVNYLQPTSNLSIYLESKNVYSEVQQGIFNAGAVATLQEFNNNSAKFTFKLTQNVPLNANLLFSINFIDGTYSDFQPLEVIANPTYATQAGNDAALTITSKGALGFNNYPTNTQGIGFKYLDSGNLLFEGGLMLTAAGKVSDAVRGANSGTQNQDFSTILPIQIFTPGVIADQEGITEFTDQSNSNPIGVKVRLHSYGFADIESDNYIILRYTITNNTSSTVSNLYAGIFTDWDLTSDGSDDFTQYDTVGQFGYARHLGTANPPLTGTAVVSNHSNGYWGILNPGGDGGFQIYDGYTDAEKIQSLTNGIGKASAGGGDISYVVSAGPVNIPASSSVDIGFAIGAGIELDDLRNGFLDARTRFQNIITDVEIDNNSTVTVFNLEQNYPNPFNPVTSIKYSIPSLSNFGKSTYPVTLKIYDLLGSEIAVLVNEQKSAGEYEVSFSAEGLSSGVYFYKLTAGSLTSTKKMIILK